MSETYHQPTDWTLYIRDMIQFAEEALGFTQGIILEEFAKDRRTYLAVLKCIEMLGLAASKVPNNAREAHPYIEWPQIVATRNLLAHVYSGIDDEAIWDIVQNDIPALLPQLRKLLEEQRGQA